MCEFIRRQARSSLVQGSVPANPDLGGVAIDGEHFRFEGIGLVIGHGYDVADVERRHSMTEKRPKPGCVESGQVRRSSCSYAGGRVRSLATVTGKPPSTL